MYDMSNLEKENKVAKSFRLSTSAVDRISAVAKHYNISEAAVLEIAVKQLDSFESEMEKLLPMTAIDQALYIEYRSFQGYTPRAAMGLASTKGQTFRDRVNAAMADGTMPECTKHLIQEYGWNIADVNRLFAEVQSQAPEADSH